MSKILGHIAIVFVALVILSGIIFSTMETGSVMKERASFAHDGTGARPHGWIAAMTGKGNPNWSVESDPNASSGKKVLKQSGVATYALLLKDGTSIKDGFVETRFKAIAGEEDRAGGVVWRAKDANNYYVLRANALENNIVLYKTVDGVRSALDIIGRKGGYGVKLRVLSGEWHSLRAEFKGSRFAAYFNGRFMFEVEDPTFLQAGQIGLWTKADSVTLFDNVSYGALPAE